MRFFIPIPKMLQRPAYAALDQLKRAQMYEELGERFANMAEQGTVHNMTEQEFIDDAMQAFALKAKQLGLTPKTPDLQEEFENDTRQRLSRIWHRIQEVEYDDMDDHLEQKDRAECFWHGIRFNYTHGELQEVYTAIKQLPTMPIWGSSIILLFAHAGRLTNFLRGMLAAHPVLYVVLIAVVCISVFVTDAPLWIYAVTGLAAPAMIALDVVVFLALRKFVRHLEKQKLGASPDEQG